MGREYRGYPERSGKGDEAENKADNCIYGDDDPAYGLSHCCAAGVWAQRDRGAAADVFDHRIFYGGASGVLGLPNCLSAFGQAAGGRTEYQGRQSWFWDLGGGGWRIWRALPGLWGDAPAAEGQCRGKGGIWPGKQRADQQYFPWPQDTHYGNQGICGRDYGRRGGYARKDGQVYQNDIQ